MKEKKTCNIICKALENNDYEIMYVGKGKDNRIVVSYIDDEDNLIGVTITLERQGLYK